MKRFSVVFLSLIFTISTLSAAVSVSYAYPYNDEETVPVESETSVPETDQTVPEDEYDSYSETDPSYYDNGYTGEESQPEDVDPSAKDTSWFDYLNPKKSYTISTEGQLRGLASLVNEEQTDNWKPTRTETFEDVTFTLDNDITLTGEWESIGFDKSYNFAGIFDGDGHTIKGLNITKNALCTGLFGYLVGEVRNLNVEGTINIGTGSCGGVAGILADTGKITDCTSKVKISAGSKIGGIAGYNNGGIIEGCTNTGAVSGTFKVGGITGENWGGTVTKCCNKAEIKSSERGVATYGTGGVAGRSVSASAEVSECYNSGIINSNTEATGGVVGYINAGGSSLKSCYNTGAINITVNKISKNGSDFIKSSAGGIAGIAGIKGVKITNCYNAGEIKNADINGGIIGSYLNEEDDEIPGTFIKNNYYMHDHSDSGIGYCDKEKTNETSSASTGVSGHSLMNMSSALGSAYMRDSSNMYGNSGYPVLSWQEPMSEEEKTYMNNVSKEVQIKLDRFMMESSKNNIYGQCVLNLFNPGNVTSSALVKYIEVQEKNDTKRYE